MLFRLLFVTYLPVLFIACSSSKKFVPAIVATTPAYKQYKVDSNYNADTAILSFLQPYSKEVNRQMNVVIGETEIPLIKKAPEGTLGYFVADAMKQMATHAYKRNVDAAFINIGGLRVDNIAAGKITLGKAYELMPFDNIVVLMQLNGSQLTQLLNLVVANDVWPLSGIKMEAKDGGAVNVFVNGEALKNDKVYTIATSDYTAKGNEGFTMLATIPQINNGYFLRDAIIDYIKDFTIKGKKINISVEGRVANAN